MTSYPRISRTTRTRRFSETGDPELADAFRRLHTTPSIAGIERRRFLQGLLAVGGVTALGGLTLMSDNAEAGPPLGADERILVVLLMAGGNDTLNMVCPLEQGAYYDKRGSFGISQSGTHSIGEGLYLHPNMSRIKSRFDNGQVAVVNGVGDSLDDHSHFVNIARWMAGTSYEGIWQNGWLGRYLDGMALDGLGGVSIGHDGVPLHMQRSNGETTGLPPSGNLFGSDYGENNKHRATYDALLAIDPAAMASKSGWASQLAATTQSAIGTAETVGQIFTPEIAEEDSLVRDAMLAARVINLDVGTRVIGISMGGYDSHDNQRPEHDDAMTSVDRAIDTLFNDIEPSLRDRVILTTFSEFGRSIEPNGGGTDHGTAGSLFVVGNAVNGGLYGEQPSLTDVDQRGDMKHHVDFRSVYATLLDGWLQADSTEIIGGNYENLGLLSYDCNGEAATIVGNANGGTIEGTNNRDVIVGLGGADLIYGRGGNDLICSGAGDDTVFAGDGNDTVYGGTGGDDLRGGDGDDTLYGEDGNDMIHGELGTDTLVGNRGADQLFGRKTIDDFVSSSADAILRGK